MRRSTLLAVLLSLACNRGPEPAAAPANPAPDPEPSAAVSANPHAAVPHAGAANPLAGAAPHAGGAPSATGSNTVDPTAPRLAGIRWSTHEPLTWRTPSSPMRNAEYFVPGAAGEALLTVFHFPGMGGSVQDNVARWVGQFQAPGGGAAEADVQSRNVAGLEVTVIDVSGAFASGMTGGPATPQEDQRLLGAIVSGPNGPVFFKLVGPADTVQATKSAFDDLVASLEPG